MNDSLTDRQTDTTVLNPETSKKADGGQIHLNSVSLMIIIKLKLAQEEDLSER